MSFKSCYYCDRCGVQNSAAPGSLPDGWVQLLVVASFDAAPIAKTDLCSRCWDALCAGRFVELTREPADESVR